MLESIGIALPLIIVFGLMLGEHAWLRRYAAKDRALQLLREEDGAADIHLIEVDEHHAVDSVEYQQALRRAIAAIRRLQAAEPRPDYIERSKRLSELLVTYRAGH